MTRSPLHEFNLGQGGRLVDFGGWQMPVQYDSVLAEHRAVRSSAGFFDVSHLGRFELSGGGAAAAVDRLLCNNIERIEPGKAQYTMMLNETGGVVDDIIIWWLDTDRFWVMPNAVNQPRVMSAFAAQPGCAVDDLQMKSAMLAVQGPDAVDVLEELLGETPGRFRTTRLRWHHADIFVAGTGYTGERGGELVTDPPTALEIAGSLLDLGIRPCGLGARDTLRLEAGFPLWGQDLSEEVSPIEAGLEFAVNLDHSFVGRGALIDQEVKGIEKKLVGFVLAERGIPRHGHRARAGSSSGEVTSGNISPMLQRGIGMAYLSPPMSSGDIDIEIRDRWTPGKIKKPPLHKD